MSEDTAGSCSLLPLGTPVADLVAAAQPDSSPPRESEDSYSETGTSLIPKTSSSAAISADSDTPEDANQLTLAELRIIQPLLKSEIVDVSHWASLPNEHAAVERRDKLQALANKIDRCLRQG